MKPRAAPWSKPADTPSPKDPYGPEGEVIDKCEKFTLYANGRPNSSPEIERALWRATLGISNRKGSEDRLELALSLLELAEHASKALRVVAKLPLVTAG